MSLDTSSSKWVSWSKERKKKKLSETLGLTLTLAKEGKSVEEIAAMRDFSNVESIEKHIHDLIGMSFLDVNDVVDPQKVETITASFKKNGMDSIKPVKEELGDEVSYHEIKCVLASFVAEPEEVKK